MRIIVPLNSALITKIGVESQAIILFAIHIVPGSARQNERCFCARLKLLFLLLLTTLSAAAAAVLLETTVVVVVVDGVNNNSDPRIGRGNSIEMFTISSSKNDFHYLQPSWRQTVQAPNVLLCCFMRN